MLMSRNLGFLGDDAIDTSDPESGLSDDAYSAYYAANEPDGTVDTSDYSGTTGTTDAKAPVAGGSDFADC